MNIYQKIFSALNKEKVKYLVVGGVAVNLYGYMRMTGDLDIVLALDKDNLVKMDKVMKKLGYYPRIPVEVKELANRDKVEQWLKEKGMMAYTFTPEKAEVLQIDILMEESLKFDKIKKVWKKINDLKIPVVSIDELIAMKKKSDRRKDIEDVEALLELKLL